MKLNPKKLAISLAITWGLFMLLVGWLAAAGWGSTDLVNALSGIYIGFKATFWGGIIGGLWGLLDGLLAGYLIAVFYNRAPKK